jgi:VWFA-related protein
VSAQAPIRERRWFRTGVELTTIAVTVTDRDGHPIPDLPRQSFEVYEDGERQQIAQFTRDRVPIGLGVLLDISDSMYGKRIQDARASVDRLLSMLLAPEDEFFLVAFNHQPHVLTTWTRDLAAVRPALAALQPWGSTAIYDAIVNALPMITQRSRERAAILIITDGADTASDTKARELRPMLLRTDAFLYAIAIDSPDPQPINARVNAEALREMTDGTGGHTDVVKTSSDLDAAAARLADELNKQYVLGYTSPRAGDGQYHSIRVRVPGYRVRARNGYVAGRIS